MAGAQIILATISAFLVGTFAANVWPTFAVFLIGNALLLFLGRSLEKRRRAPRYLVLLLALSFSLGFLYVRFDIELARLRNNVPTGQPIFGTLMVQSEPTHPRDTYQSFDADLNPPYHGRIRVLTAPLADIAYGDRLAFSGVIEPAEPPDRPISLFPKLQTAARGQGNPILQTLFAFKALCVRTLVRFLPRNEAAFAAGLTLGDTNDFSETLKGQFRDSGTTHLVALSGYNISILIIAIATTLGRFLSRRLTFGLTLLAIIFFVLTVGAAASVVRAALMGALTLFATYSGRRGYLPNIIASTALVMTLWEPTVLSQNIGFQLSFGSVLGLIYLGPVLNRYFGTPAPKATPSFGFREQFLTTLAAQLAVIPLIAHTFGGFSATSLIANLLILPFIPLTMLFSFGTIALGLTAPIIAPLMGWLNALPLWYELHVIQLFATLRLPLPELFGSWTTITIYYAILIFLAYYFRPKELPPLSST